MTYKPSLRTFEEDVLATWWREPYFLQPYTLPVLQAGEAAGIDMLKEYQFLQRKQHRKLMAASGKVFLIGTRLTKGEQARVRRSPSGRLLSIVGKQHPYYVKKDE